MNLGMPEMIFIFLLALVVVGPRRLPELGRQLGKFLAEFKRASNEFKQQLETEMLNIELEERAKKAQEEPQVLPPEPADRVMRPVAETVGHTRSELAPRLNQMPGEPGMHSLTAAPEAMANAQAATSCGSPATSSPSN